MDRDRSKEEGEGDKRHRRRRLALLPPFPPSELRNGIHIFSLPFWPEGCEGRTELGSRLPSPPPPSPYLRAFSWSYPKSGPDCLSLWLFRHAPPPWKNTDTAQTSTRRLCTAVVLPRLSGGKKGGSYILPPYEPEDGGEWAAQLFPPLASNIAREQDKRGKVRFCFGKGANTGGSFAFVPQARRPVNECWMEVSFSLWKFDSR